MSFENNYANPEDTNESERGSDVLGERSQEEPYPTVGENYDPGELREAIDKARKESI